MNIVRSDYMSKKRIYEYAKELNVKSKEIIDELKKMDVEVSNHMQALEDDQIKILNKKFKSSKNEENKKQNTQNNHQKQQNNNSNKNDSHALGSLFAGPCFQLLVSFILTTPCGGLLCLAFYT